MSDLQLKQTPMHSLHQELNAKMVPFAGYDMPVQYPLGIKQEHLHTRDKVGLFDVSHMGQFLVTGANAEAELERLIPVDLSVLAPKQQTYGLFTNESGGINDDLMICRWDDNTFYLVVNAACKEQGLNHLKENLHSAEVEVLADRALLALQGPLASKVMGQVAPECNELIFMNSLKTDISGALCYISRSGYTGEDGFEISVPSNQAQQLAQTFLKFDEVEAIGLGARDTLRLEAGLCLYGHDMNTKTTPVEASLTWSIGKTRRLGGSKVGGFLGAEIILNQAPTQKRVGLLIEGRRLVREGAELFDEQDNKVGMVTSGGFSPTLEAPIAIAYVSCELAELGSVLYAKVRDNKVKVMVSKMPFVVQRYFRG